MREAKEFGYARVSSKDQNLARQIDALKGVGLDDAAIFADKASGKDFKRPAYRRMLRRLKPGDVLYVKSIDRLGRNYEEIIGEWRCITRNRGADIVVLDMPLLDTRQGAGGVTGAFLSDMILQILSYVAQIERDNIRLRQAEGIASAKARGVRFGRPKIERPGHYSEVKDLYLRGVLKRAEAACALEVSVSTFGVWLREDKCQ